MTKQQFNTLLEDSMFDDIEKQIARMIYLEHKDMRLIADELGYCEKTIQRKHKLIKKFLIDNNILFSGSHIL